MPEAIVTRLLRLARYKAYAHEVDERTSRLTLWVRQAQEPYYACGGCGISIRDVHSWTERRVRDLPWGTWQVWLVLDVHRVRCPPCGVRTERLPFVAGKAPYTTRLEAAIARDCEAAPVSRVAQAWHLPAETVRRLDQRMLRRWAAGRPRTPLRFLGVDEIYLGCRDKFLTIVSDLETGEPLWAGRDRKRETLDRFFAEALPPARRRAVRAVCVDMWEPFTQSVRTHLPRARIVYDKFHVLRHVTDALDETRRAEFFRQGGAARALWRGKRWLLLRAWGNLERDERHQLRELPRPQPPSCQSASAQGAARAPLGLHLRRRGVALSDRLGPCPAVATVTGLRQGRPAAQSSPRRHPGLLPRQGAVRQGQSHQRQHPRDAPAGAWLSRPRVSAPQGAEGDGRAPSVRAPSRMNPGPVTDSGEERYFPVDTAPPMSS